METSLRGLHLWYYTWCVICAQLFIANTSRPCSHRVVCGFEGDGFEPCGVVGTDWGGDYVEERRSRGAYAEGALGPNHCGTKIERIAAGATLISTVGRGLDRENNYAGIKRSSRDTNFEMRSMKAEGSIVGRAIRADDVFRRAMFFSGLKRRIFPFLSL